jgi:hypothetical protein
VDDLGCGLLAVSADDVQHALRPKTDAVGTLSGAAYRESVEMSTKKKN